MRITFLVLFLLINICFPQSLLNRLIVPLYIESEISYGFDDNYLKLSKYEKNDDDIHSIMGDSKSISSDIFKNKINILYIPYIFRNHETRFDFRLLSSNYKSSQLKSYYSYHFKLSQHLAAYTWIKLSYSYNPSFYIKSYYKRDPYILFEESLGLYGSDYFPALFS